MPNLMTGATDEIEAQAMLTDDPEPDHVEVPEDEIGENGRRDYEDDLDDGGEIELDEGTLLEKARSLGEIQDAEMVVAEAEREWKEAKEIATARKEDFDSAVGRMRRIIKASKESHPLFDRNPESSAVAHGSDLNGAEGVQLSTVAGFPEGVARALEEQADVTTVGQLAAWSKSKDLVHLKGVGPAKADAASDAMANFWRDWNAKYPPKADGPGAAG